MARASTGDVFEALSISCQERDARMMQGLPFFSQGADTKPQKPAKTVAKASSERANAERTQKIVDMDD